MGLLHTTLKHVGQRAADAMGRSTRFGSERAAHRHPGLAVKRGTPPPAKYNVGGSLVLAFRLTPTASSGTCPPGLRGPAGTDLPGTPFTASVETQRQCAYAMDRCSRQAMEVDVVNVSQTSGSTGRTARLRCRPDRLLRGVLTSAPVSSPPF
jgi:hypothetical protein